MRLLAASTLVAAFACSGGTATPLGTDTGESADGADGSADGADGTSEGTDNDGDGFTVEEGDCDDDNIAVNPAREEDVFDGIDNDCDGRIDEEWSGLAVTEQVQGGRSRIVTYDTITRETGSLTLPEDHVPYDIGEGLNGGFVTITTEVFINFSAGTPGFEYSGASVLEVADDGTVRELTTFVDEAWEAEDAENMKFYWFGPIVRGISWHPGGYYVAATPGTLWRIDPSGAKTELASWAWDINDADTFELYALDLAVDRLTGEVAILDLLGGFATWTEADGFVQTRKADLSDGWANWDAKVGVGVSRMDADGWWAMTADFTTGAYDLSRYNEADDEWVVRMDWSNDLVRPLGVAAEGDSGEAYVTAKGGDYRTIWRLREQGSLVDDALAEVEDGKTLWGILPTY